MEGSTPEAVNMTAKFKITPHLPTSDVQRMVDFYVSIGFTLNNGLGVKDGVPVFAHLNLNECEIRIELWNLPDWDILKKGFSVTTLWIDTDFIDSVAELLRTKNIPFHDQLMKTTVRPNWSYGTQRDSGSSSQKKPRRILILPSSELGP